MPVRRIVYTRQSLPAVELVDFTLNNGDIVIRTDASGRLAAATRDAVDAISGSPAGGSEETRRGSGSAPLPL